MENCKRVVSYRKALMKRQLIINQFSLLGGIFKLYQILTTPPYRRGEYYSQVDERFVGLFKYLPLSAMVEKCTQSSPAQNTGKLQNQTNQIGFKYKQCPNCRFWVEKNEGCDHMTCRCKYEFCYVCGGKYGVCRCSGHGGQEPEELFIELPITAPPEPIQDSPLPILPPLPPLSPRLAYPNRFEPLEQDDIPLLPGIMPVDLRADSQWLIVLEQPPFLHLFCNFYLPQPVQSLSLMLAVPKRHHSCIYSNPNRVVSNYATINIFYRRTMDSNATPTPPALDINKLTNDYANSLNAVDSAIGQQMQSQIVRVIFEILINLAYVLFGLGVVLGLKGGVANLQYMSEYISKPGEQALLCVIAVMALVIFSISQVFSKSTALSTRAKKDLDLAVDSVRVVVYIFTGIFFGQFVYHDPQSSTLILSFWAFVLAATLFLVRKIVKWYIFLFREPENMKPWENFVVTSPLDFLKIAQFQQYMAQKMQEHQAEVAKQASKTEEAKPASVRDAAKPKPPINTTRQLTSNLTGFEMGDRLIGTRQGIDSNDEEEMGRPL